MRSTCISALPPEAGPAVERYNELLDEADEYCRRFELLTIAPTDEAVAVRSWAFGQIVTSAKARLQDLGLGRMTNA